MITRLAWKNIWRTPKRSLTVMGSMVLGIWALIFIIAFYNSFMTAFTRTSIKHEHSHIQVHNPAYLDDPDITKVLSTSSDLQELLSQEAVKAYSGRQIADGMIASSRATAGVKIYGVEAEAEARTTLLQAQLVEGSYFEKISRNPILISEKVAKKLSVKVRSKVVLTFQDINQNILSASFRVEGIFESKSARINEQVAYVRKTDLGRLIGLSAPHELAILLEGEDAIAPFQVDLMKVSADSVRNFREIAPEFNLMEESSATTQRVMVGIVMLALLFGIINTMLMAILERTREIGMLRAVGMQKRKVFTMVITETCLLGIVAGPIGLFLGFLTVTWLGKTGIDFSMYASALKSYGVDTVFYPEIANSTYIVLMLIVLVTAFLGAIYPALMAIRLNPLEAIRKI